MRQARCRIWRQHGVHSHLRNRFKFRSCKHDIRAITLCDVTDPKQWHQTRGSFLRSGEKCTRNKTSSIAQALKRHQRQIDGSRDGKVFVGDCVATGWWRHVPVVITHESSGDVAKQLLDETAADAATRAGAETENQVLVVDVPATARAKR